MRRVMAFLVKLFRYGFIGLLIFIVASVAITLISFGIYHLWNPVLVHLIPYVVLILAVGVLVLLLSRKWRWLRRVLPK